MALFVVLSHQNLILNVEMADIIVQVDIFANQKGSYDRVFNSSAEGPPG